MAVAFSGGRDSLALLHATCRAAQALGLQVVALHIHHGLLADADGWLRRAQQLCTRWRRHGWPLTLRWQRLDGQPAPGDSIEAWARAGRHAALAAMAAEAEKGGWGVLLYLRQEGRGLGLINKLRAYRLQDQGFDTVDANNRLGLPTEARDFPVAARMLALLGVRAIRLMTNNPAKVAALEATGVTVTERVPHQLPPNPHNARYLDTKRDRTGHLL